MFKIYYLTIALLISFTNPISASAENKPEPICSEVECWDVIQILGEGAFGRVYAVESADGQKFAIKMYKGFFNFNNNSYPSTYDTDFSTDYYSSTDFDSWSGSDTYSWSGSDSYSWSDSNYDSYGSSVNEHFFDWIGLLNDPKREYERGRILDHPNIIKSYTLFFEKQASSKDVQYLVLQYVDGKTVGSTAFGSISEREAKVAAKHLIEGLQYALSLDYLHLDLHTGNLMFDKNKDIMIVDLASFFSDKEILGYAAKEMQQVVAKGILPAPKEEKEQKLKQFFDKNPKLLNLLQKNMQVKPKSFAQEASPKSNAKLNLYVSYLDRVTETAIMILEWSNMKKETLDAIKVDLRTLSSNLKKDVTDGVASQETLDTYINEVLLRIDEESRAFSS